MCNTFKLPLVVHLLQSSATSVLNIRAVQDAFAFILGNGLWSPGIAIEVATAVPYRRS